MASARSLLEYILRSKKEGDAAKQANEELKDLGKTAKETGGFASFLGDNFALTGTDLVSMAKAVPAVTMELLDQGIAIKRAETALIGYTGSSEEAEKATIAVAAAAGHAITNFEATQNASRLFAMGLANSTDEAAKLTEMAVTLGAAMGEDASTSFENFSLMLANQSIPRLDTFGISGAEVRNRMAELTDEIEGLDRQTAFMMATMEIGTEALEDLDAAGFEAIDNVSRLKAEYQNLKDELAVAVADGLVPMIDSGMALRDTMREVVDQTVTGSDTYEEYTQKLETLKEENWALLGSTQQLTQGQWAAQRASQGMSEATEEAALAAGDADIVLGYYGGTTDELAGSLDGATGSTDGLTASTDLLTLSLMKVTEATLAKDAIEALSGAYQDGTIDGDAYDAMVKSIMTSLGGMTSTEADTSIALQKLEQAYEDGTIDALAYFQGVTDLSGAIRGLKDKTVNIYVKTHGNIPILPGKGDRPIALQSGGQFTVTGPPGIDAVPVEFMATRGETVTVSRQGIQPPGSGGSGGGLVIDARGAHFYGTAGIQDFADRLIPHIDRARRNA